jgi:hypothetical protein
MSRKDMQKVHIAIGGFSVKYDTGYASVDPINFIWTLPLNVVPVINYLPENYLWVMAIKIKLRQHIYLLQNTSTRSYHRYPLHSR